MSEPVSLSPDNRWSVSPGSLADVDVSLGRKHQGQPDARVVEHLRRSLSQHLKQETRGAAPVHVQVAEQRRQSDQSYVPKLQ